MNPKVKVVVGISSLTPEAKVVKSQSIIDSMQVNPNFPDATMPMHYPSIQTIITNSHNANIAASNGTSADISKMHEEEKMLVMTMNLIRAHVEIVCNALPNPEAEILSIGMSVASNSGKNAVSDLTLDAIGGGTIQIRVPRTNSDKSFSYQYALDSDPTNWQSVGFNSLSKINFTNQTPGTVIHIRYAPIGSMGMGTYSNSKSIMVI